MSNNNKLRRERREAEQEKQAKRVINWIFAALVIFAVIFLAIYMTSK